MRYTVTLYQYKNLPYTITDIDAIDEDEAIHKAKEFVASHGYFPRISLKKIMDNLVIEEVIKIETDIRELH